MARLLPLLLLLAACGRVPFLDGRTPIRELYRRYDALAAKPAWVKETVFVDSGLPIVVLRTRRWGPALWVLAGIHGEEPAPPDALADALPELDALAVRGVSIVLFPLCNPAGYSKGWRYPDARRAPGHSVGDSDHLLLDKAGKPRAPGPSSPQADALTRKVLELARDYPPLLSLDLHEDDELDAGYVYSQGPSGRGDPAAQAVVARMRELGFPVMTSGQTRFGEAISSGVISDVSDGSIDELLAARRVLQDGRSAPGPAARSAIVVETSSKGRPLSERRRVHRAVISLLGELPAWARP